MDFRQMRYFVALYEAGSVTKAARLLNVVQPAVSQQIRNIEIDCGAALFDRTARGMVPTQAAERLYPICRDILDGERLLHSVIQETTGKALGVIRVGVQATLTQCVLGDFLVEFSRTHPGIRCIIREGYSSGLVNWIHKGEVDFAILSIEDADKRLKLHRMLNEPLVVVSNSQSECGAVVRGSELSQFHLILPSHGNLMRSLIDIELERAGLSVLPAMEVDSMPAVFQIVRHPGWATITAGSAFSEEQWNGRLKVSQLVEPEISRTLVAATLPGRSMSLASTLFIEGLGNAIRRHLSISGGHRSPRTHVALFEPNLDGLPA